MKKKTIFATITLGLVTLLGFGILGAVNYQPKEAKASEITTTLKPKRRKITLSSSDFGNDNLYYFVAKDYQNNGKPTFYNGTTPSLENSVTTSQTGGFLSTEMQIPMTIIRATNYYQMYLSFIQTQYNGIWKLNHVYFNGNEGGNNVYIYSASLGQFNRQNCAFVATQLKNRYTSNDISIIVGYLNQFFDVYNITDYYSTFDFIESTNYNAFLNTSVDNFINRAMYPVADYLTSDGQPITRTFDTPIFKSNGLVFNQIKAVYRSNLGQSFEFSDGHFATIGNPLGNYMTYFSSLSYVNTATNLEVVVASRTSVGEGDNVNEHKILYKLYWTSDAFRHIEFTTEVVDLLLKYTLSSANMGYDTTEYQINNAGLGDAFGLISQAFTAWLPILSISVVPGITLGLLLFLPLIAGIIIFIIWIVKR